MAPGDVSRVVHGTTLATNVILEQKGSPLAFVVTEGFADLLRLGREARVEDDRYDLFFTTPAPPVDPKLTFEVPERVKADGSVLRALSADAAADVARRVAGPVTTAVAICLLNAYANPEHERCMRTRPARRASRRVRRGVHRGLARDARVRARDDHGDVRVCRAGHGRLPRGPGIAARRAGHRRSARDHGLERRGDVGVARRARRPVRRSSPAAPRA